MSEQEIKEVLKNGLVMLACDFGKGYYVDCKKCALASAAQRVFGNPNIDEVGYYIKIDNIEYTHDSYLISHHYNDGIKALEHNYDQTPIRTIKFQL